VQEAVENNPEIRAAAQRYEATKAMIPQARTLPDPMIILSYEDMPVRETMYGVSQEIPFPGKLRLKGEIASREADQAEQEYFAVRLGVIARLKEAYFEQSLLYQSTVIIEESQQLLVQFSKAAEAGYTVGKMVQADVFRAQAEVSRSLARLATIRQRQRSVSAELVRLLNRSPGESLIVPEATHPKAVRRNLADLINLIDQAPLLLARSEGVERGNAAIALARREYLPDFEIGVQGVREEPMGENGYQLMLNVTVPLYYATKQRYGVHEANAAREQAVEDFQAAHQELVMRVQDEVAQINRAEELIALLSDAIIPQAQFTLDSAKAAYSVGQVDFLTLLNSLLTLQESELELQAEIAEHEKSRARLEEIIGEEP
jgi:outer membrane protein TolC